MKLRELVALIDSIKKDMSYTRSLQERWQKEKKRFPILYASIEKQSEYFKKQIESLFDAEVSDKGLSEYVHDKLASLRSSGTEQPSIIELQTLEEAAKEADALTKKREEEQAKQLAQKVKETMESHLPKDAKGTEKVRELGEEVVKQIEKPKKE
ncbi:MAG: hypothetical protein N2234_03955 [Planctomycetota bacterium]|nr:hypothetical protein [Planctomycetota bacterium]